MIRPKQFLAWAVETFGPVALDRDERTARFVEEALELAHAEGLPEEVIRKIRTRVYSRQRGHVRREIGQALVMLECLAENIGVSAEDEAQREWERVQGIPKAEWTERHADKAALGIANLSGQS